MEVEEEVVPLSRLEAILTLSLLLSCKAVAAKAAAAIKPHMLVMVEAKVVEAGLEVVVRAVIPVPVDVAEHKVLVVGYLAPVAVVVVGVAKQALVSINRL